MSIILHAYTLALEKLLISLICKAWALKNEQSERGTSA